MIVAGPSLPALPPAAFDGALPGSAKGAAVILVILLGLAVPAPFFLGGDGDNLSGQGNAFRQLAYLMVFAGALLTAGVLRSPRRLFAIPPEILIVLLWCALSLGWAVEPGIAMRRLALTVMVVWSVFLLVRQAGYRRTIQTFRLVLPVILAINFATVFAAPAIGVHQTGEALDPGLIGAWRGILGQKNYAGPVCALTILFFLFDGRELRLSIRVAVMAAAAVFLVGTESKTSMGVLAVSIVAALAFRIYQPRYRLLALHLAALALVAIALLAWSWRDVLLAPFSREDALTGRVQIWPVLLAYARDNVMLGSGYGSFWNIGEASPVYRYTLGWVSRLASGHNGYLDLLVQIGAPGLALVAIAMVVMPAWRFITDRSLDRTRGALLFSLFTFVVLHNATESTLLDRDAALSLTLMAVIALLRVERRAVTDGGRAIGGRAVTDEGVVEPVTEDVATTGLSGHRRVTVEPPRGRP